MGVSLRWCSWGMSACTGLTVVGWRVACVGVPQFHLPITHPHPCPHGLQDPKDRDRVDRECRVMRNLSNHAAVIRLFETAETRDCVYIVMEAAARG